MQKLLNNWLHKTFPQNYIIRKPFRGMLITALFTFIFAVTYQPLNAHEAKALSLVETMAVYCLIAGLSVFLFIHLVKRIPFFADQMKWTFFKESIAIVIILFGLGIVIYVVAFWLEPPANRWNMATFLDSLANAFLIGIIPFTFFTAMNYHYWLNQKEENITDHTEAKTGEKKIQIASRLKKEKLSFYPSQLLYVESDGNYVNFYIRHEGAIKKKVIRNSITNIENQLSSISSIFRTHRAFIVNITQVAKRKGNSSGYRLFFKDTNAEVPVSRKNTKAFDELFKNYHQ
jgi:hypothetical protein